MTLREIHTYRITCDGEHPEGGRCPCGITSDGESEADAEAYALDLGWTLNVRGKWFCNSVRGHKDKQ